MDSDHPPNTMYIETEIPEGARFAQVVFTFPGSMTPTTMLVPLFALDEALENLRNAAADYVERRDALAEVERPIPEAVLVECVPEAGDKCSICLEEVAVDEIVVGLGGLGLLGEVDGPAATSASLLMEAGGPTAASLHGEAGSLSATPASPLAWISLSRCHHRFHARCIRRWERSTCPNCREYYGEDGGIWDEVEFEDL